MARQAEDYKLLMERKAVDSNTGVIAFALVLVASALYAVWLFL